MSRIFSIYFMIAVGFAFYAAPMFATLCNPNIPRPTCAYRAMLIGLGAGAIWPYSGYIFLRYEDKFFPSERRPASLPGKDRPKWEREISFTQSMR